MSDGDQDGGVLIITWCVGWRWMALDGVGDGRVDGESKAENNEELRRLKIKLAKQPGRSGELKTIERLLDVVVERFSNILETFKNQPVEEKENNKFDVPQKSVF